MGFHTISERFSCRHKKLYHIVSTKPQTLTLGKRPTKSRTAGYTALVAITISIQLQVCFHLPCCILCLQSLYVLSTFNKHQHFNVAQVTQFYLKLGSIKAYNNYYAPISLFSSENTYAFSATCDICKLKPVKPVFWSTNTMRYLYSFLALFVLKLNNNIKQFQFFT